MLLASVIGTVVSTRKTESLTGVKLLVVQSGDGHKMVVADRLGAGVGDKVLVAQGSTAHHAFSNEKMPIDAAIVGIVDHVEESV